MTVSSLYEVELYLKNLPVRTKNYEGRLKHVKTILSSLGNPQDTVPSIHIAGTSGKGSTAYYTTSLLVNAGYSVGLIVSPHVHTVKERAQVNGAPLSDDVYIKYFNAFIDEIKDVELTYIEFLTIFSFWLFARLNVEYLVVEVGLGGRLDPTNVLSRQDTVRIITDIGLDHVEILGSTLPIIASEKAGIIHSNNIVIMSTQDDEIINVIQARCVEENASLFFAQPDAPIDLNSLPLYQQRNWLLAYAAASRRLALDNKPLLSEKNLVASSSIQIPGRFERKTYGGVEMILDAAHNPQKIKALVASLGVYKPDVKPVVLVAFGNNKLSAVSESLSLIQPIAFEIITTEFHLDFHGDHSAIEATRVNDFLDNSSKHTAITSLETALSQAVTLASENNTYIVITGSFYLLDNLYPLITKPF